MLQLTVQYDNIDLTEIDKALHSPNIMRSFAAYRKSEFNQQIALGVNPYGEALPELTATYAKWKREKVGNKPKRVLTGATKRSYQQRVFGTQLIERVGGKAAFIQNRFPYLPTADRGIPAKDQDKLLNIATLEVERATRKLMRRVKR